MNEMIYQLSNLLNLLSTILLSCGTMLIVFWAFRFAISARTCDDSHQVSQIFSGVFFVMTSIVLKFSMKTLLKDTETVNTTSDNVSNPVTESPIVSMPENNIDWSAVLNTLLTIGGILLGIILIAGISFGVYKLICYRVRIKKEQIKENEYLRNTSLEDLADDKYKELYRQADEKPKTVLDKQIDKLIQKYEK